MSLESKRYPRFVFHNLFFHNNLLRRYRLSLTFITRLFIYVPITIPGFRFYLSRFYLYFFASSFTLMDQRLHRSACQKARVLISSLSPPLNEQEGRTKSQRRIRIETETVA